MRIFFSMITYILEFKKIFVIIAVEEEEIRLKHVLIYLYI